MSDEQERQIRYMDIEEFRDFGFLQEVNRQVLHPAGLALEVRHGWTDEALDKYLRQNGVQFGEEARANIRTFLRLAGLDKMHLGGVWDDRDDPEGTAYGFPIDFRKVMLVRGEQERHAEVRQAHFGWVVQPPYSEGHDKPIREITKAIWAVYEASGPMYDPEDGPISDLDRIDEVFNSSEFMQAVADGGDPEETYIRVAREMGFTWE